MTLFQVATIASTPVSIAIHTESRCSIVTSLQHPWQNLKWLQCSIVATRRHPALLWGLFRERCCFPSQQKLPFTSAPKQLTRLSSNTPQVGLRFQLTVSPNFRSHIWGSPSNTTEGLPGLVRETVQAHLDVKSLAGQICPEKVSSKNANSTPLDFPHPWSGWGIQESWNWLKNIYLEVSTWWPGISLWNSTLIVSWRTF